MIFEVFSERCFVDNAILILQSYLKKIYDGVDWIK